MRKMVHVLAHRSHSIPKKISTTFHRPSVLIACDALRSAEFSRLTASTLCFLLFMDPANMAESRRIRNPDWKEDEQLKEDLKRYVLQNLSRQDILDFVSRDYAQYAWSLGSLSRRLAFFNVKYVDTNTDLNVVQDAVQKELEGPGQFLGYRSMQRKIREQHNLAVPHNLVYDMMARLDQEGLDRRGDVVKKK